MNDEAHAGMLALDCAYCGALAGQWCVTVSGARSGYLHSARFYAWRERTAADPDWPVFGHE
jgi:hypothetical protein